VRSSHVALLLLFGLQPLEAQAIPFVAVRGGDHPGHGRVVFDWPEPTRYQLEERGEGRVMLRFAEPAEFDLAMVRRGVRNLAGIEAAGQDATLATRPGVRVRHFRLGGRVVVDLLDPEGFVQAAAELAPRVGLPPRAAPAEAMEPVQLAQAAPALPGRPALPPIPVQPAPEPRPAQVPGAPIPTQLRLEAGTGRLVALPGQAATVMAADPRVARVQPASPTSVFIMAVANGRTTVIATSEIGQPVAEFDITVFGGRAERGERGERPEGGEERTQRPLNAGQIESQIRTLVGSPGRIRVRVAGRVVHLSGTVGSASDARRAEAIARGMGNEDTEVLNEIAVLSSIQVNLRVRVAEISRDVTRQFGFNWQAIGSSGNFLFGLRSGASSGFLANSILGPVAAAGGTLSSPQRIGAGFRSGSTDVNGLIDALAADNLISILAEPNLTAQSGEVASFLAGGEFPIPVSARENTISIEFKQFGVSLAFIPTVLAPDRLSLRVRPEVSELSEQGAVSLPFAGGTLRIPALSVRRAETTIELGSGQSFAIAGLLQRSVTQGQDGLNGLTDIPVLGALFRSDRFQRRETELVIIVTPYLVRPVSDPTALTSPTDGFRPATSLDRILYQRQLERGAPTPQAPTGVGFRLQ
jgi:pilus assembly protein CpaC